ncbi:MAG TPA: vanadium-dependent haloperoxidase [Candidatus Dormibacteraeota bacterium]|nr:vanadium-dependent haloperoxidase [Candidatus Dormibacteraeota bacterium]
MKRRLAWPTLALLALVAALIPAPASAASISPAVALDWNATAVAAVRAAITSNEPPPGASSRALYQTEGLLYMAYVQAAVYDATMKISHRYLLYHHFVARAGNASLTAAVIAAYYNTLVAYLGDPGNVLAAKYASDLAALPHDANTARGVAVGMAASEDIVDLRANDGRNADVPFACPTDTTPGAYQCAPPPSIQTEQTPWVATMQPFMLLSDSQFRAPAPPALDSAQYVADFNETKALGLKTSAVRTATQTAIGYFWNANAISQENKTLRDAASQYGLDLVDTVRLLAAGTMVSTDAGIACFDSKYHWLRWRPITAIRADGIAADAGWVPLVNTPNHPEYPSQHGCVTGSSGDVLATLLGTPNFNLTIWGANQATPTALATSESFATEADLDSELVNARIYIGFHFRTSVLAGESIGHSVADWELQRFFLPGDDES